MTVHFHKLFLEVEAKINFYWSIFIELRDVRNNNDKKNYCSIFLLIYLNISELFSQLS